MEQIPENYSLIGDIILLMKNNLIGVFFLISIFIEFTPIKVNPISAAMDFLLKPIREDVKNVKEDIDNKMDDIENKIAEIKDDQDKARFSTCRWEILTFASSLNFGQLYTEQEYQHIKEIIQEYNMLCVKCKLQNGHTDDAVQVITEHHNMYKGAGTKFY